jgi:hypothetical protein
VNEEPFFSPRPDLPIGEYQAEVYRVIKARTLGEHIIMFRLTEPKKSDKEHPQRGLGGRLVPAHLLLDNDNPVTREEAEAMRDQLLTASRKLSLEAARGEVIRIRLARVVMRSDPSRTRVAAVEFLPLNNYPKPYIET